MTKVRDWMYGISICITICAVLLVGLFVWTLLDYSIGTIKASDYCSEHFPSPIHPGIRDGGTTDGIEPGFVKCCRNVYTNHEITRECKILPYDKEEG